MMKIFSFNCKENSLRSMMSHMEACVEICQGITLDVEDLGNKESQMHLTDRKQCEWTLVVINLKEKEELKRVLNQRGGTMKKGEKEQKKEKRTWLFNGERVVVNIQDICYIESYQRKTTVHTVKGEFRIKTKLAEEEHELASKGFVRVHHGYLVRKDKIKKVERFFLTLKDGTIVPVSKRYRKKLKSYLNEYDAEITQK